MTKPHGTEGLSPADLPARADDIADEIDAAFDTGAIKTEGKIQKMQAERTASSRAPTMMFTRQQLEEAQRNEPTPPSPKNK